MSRQKESDQQKLKKFGKGLDRITKSLCEALEDSKDIIQKLNGIHNDQNGMIQKLDGMIVRSSRLQRKVDQTSFDLDEMNQLVVINPVTFISSRISMQNSGASDRSTMIDI